MEIKGALEATGKASRPEWAGATQYVYEKNGDYYMTDGSQEAPYPSVAISDNNWNTYHDKKEIRPENAGELWDYEGKKYFFHWSNHTTTGSYLCFTSDRGEIISVIEAIHNQNGWERIHPPVQVFILG